MGATQHWLRAMNDGDAGNLLREYLPPNELRHRARAALLNLIWVHHNHRVAHSAFVSLILSIQRMGQVCNHRSRVNDLCVSLCAGCIASSMFVGELSRCGMACSPVLAENIDELQHRMGALRKAKHEYSKATNDPNYEGWHSMRGHFTVSI